MNTQDENGFKRPVSSFVKPLRAGRLLDTPRQAARFVALMHHEKVQALGGGDKVEQWTSAHAFLCRNRGVSKKPLVSTHTSCSVFLSV